MYRRSMRADERVKGIKSKYICKGLLEFLAITSIACNMGFVETVCHTVRFSKKTIQRFLYIKQLNFLEKKISKRSKERSLS